MTATWEARDCLEIGSEKERGPPENETFTAGRIKKNKTNRGRAHADVSTPLAVATTSLTLSVAVA